MSQLEHMCQAAQLAEAAGADDEVALAAFFYDLRQFSEASRATLAFQGGSMSPAEAAAFEQDPDAELILQLRQWDEQAKEADRPVGSLDWLKEMALRHLQRQPA